MKWRVVVRQFQAAARVIECKSKRDAEVEAARWRSALHPRTPFALAVEVVHPRDWPLYAGVWKEAS
jgi:hypothetical protein